MLQPKKHDKNSQDQVNEKEVYNLPETEFRVMTGNKMRHESNRYNKCLPRT